MKKGIWVLILSLFLVGAVFGREGSNPSPKDSSKAKAEKIEAKRFKDKDKDGFNDLREKGSYEKFLKEAIKEKKGRR